MRGSKGLKHGLHSVATYGTGPQEEKAFKALMCALKVG